MYKYIKNKRSRQACCGLCNMSDNTYQQQMQKIIDAHDQKIIDEPDQKNNDFEINTQYDNDL